MNIPEQLKLNKFRLVRIPSTRDMFARFGPREAPASDFTGDEYAVSESTKVQQLARSNAELAEALANEPDNE